jgi:predicted MFS family arabinose efflux permease
MSTPDPPESLPMNARLAAAALMLGNFAVGCAVVAPAAMLIPLAADLSVSIRDAGLLIAFGAVVLCVGAPLMVWATSILDRRILLAMALGVLIIGQTASALAPGYIMLLILRLALLVGSSVFTPVAASTISLMVRSEERSGYIAFAFLGWPLAIAAGLPLMAFVTDLFGWRAAYGMIAIIAAVAVILLVITLPGGLRGAPISLRSWADVARNRLIVRLLLITTLWIAGFYVVFPYLGPALAGLAGAGASEIAAVFALSGIMALVGGTIATRIVGRLGAFRTSLVSLSMVLAGMLVWSFGAGSLIVMGLGMAILGLGVSATPSMIQSRLIGASPVLASAAASLHTSALYIGQGLGSWIGGELIARGLTTAMSAAAIGFLTTALVVLWLTREQRSAVRSS